MDARMVPLHEVGRHPRNVRRKVGDTTELESSIREYGLLEPLVVCSVDAFIAANPELAQELEIGNWVLIAGERRTEACDRVGLEEVPVVVREDLAPLEQAIKAMLGENGARADLTPLEEAAGFRYLQEAGHSHRAIAEATGASRGHVAKRLSLLRLPDTMAAAVDEGKLTVSDALTLLELPDQELAAAWKQAQGERWRGVDGVVAERKSAAESKRAMEKALAGHEAAGVEVVKTGNLEKLLGRRWFAQRWPYGTTLDDIEEPTAVVATMRRSGGGVAIEYFWREEQAADGASDGSDEEDEEDRLAAEREAAIRAGTEARGQVCRGVLARELPVKLAAEILAETVLETASHGALGGQDRAAEFAGVELPPDPERYTYPNPRTEAAEAWLAEQAAAGGAKARRAAVALALGEAEAGLAGYWREEEWTPYEIAHVRRLVAVGGHELSEFEVAEIGRGEAALERAAEEAARKREAAAQAAGDEEDEAAGE